MHVYFKGGKPIDLVKNRDGEAIYSRNLLLNSAIVVKPKSWIQWDVDATRLRSGAQMTFSADAIKTGLDGETLWVYFQGLSSSAHTLSPVIEDWTRLSNTWDISETEAGKQAIKIHAAIADPSISADVKKVKLGLENIADYTPAPEDITGTTATTSQGGEFS